MDFNPGTLLTGLTQEIPGSAPGTVGEAGTTDADAPNSSGLARTYPQRDRSLRQKLGQTKAPEWNSVRYCCTAPPAWHPRKNL